MITALKFRDVIKRRIRQLGKRHHQTRSFNEPFNFKRAYLSSLKFAIESNALYVNLLLWHSKTTQTTFVPSNVSLNNPSKKEIGKMSKQIVGKINSDIIEKLKLNHWRIINAVLKSFSNVTDKSISRFIQFDMKEIYRSITENILQQTLKFAKKTKNKHSQEQATHYKTLLQIVTILW